MPPADDYRPVAPIHGREYVSKKGYLRHHELQVLPIIFVVAGLVVVAVILNHPPLVAVTVAAGLIVGTFGGFGLGAMSWWRDARRIEQGAPLYTYAGWRWFLWFLFFIGAPLWLGTVYNAVAGLVPPADQPGFLLVVLMAIVPASVSISATRITLIRRYERAQHARLVGIFRGHGPLDVRELRVVAEPRSSEALP